MLEKLFPNLKTHEAHNGKQALDISREIKPDLILLDLYMPDASGEDFLQEYQKEPFSKDSILIIISGKTSTPDYNKIMGMGVQAYLYKPVRFFELKEELQYYFKNETGTYHQQPHLDYNELIEIVHGDSVLLTKMYQVAYQQFEDDIEHLGNVIKKGEFEKIKECAHRLKGASASLCFKRLSTLSSLLCKNSKDKKILETNELFHKMKNEWYFLKELLKKEYI